MAQMTGPSISRFPSLWWNCSWFMTNVSKSLSCSVDVSQLTKVSRFSHQSPRVSVEIHYASDGSCPLPRQEPQWSVRRCWDKQEVTRILRGKGLLTVAKRMGGSGWTVWELGWIVFCLISVWCKVTVCMYIRNGDRESVWSFCGDSAKQVFCGSVMSF